MDGLLIGHLILIVDTIKSTIIPAKNRQGFTSTNPYYPQLLVQSLVVEIMSSLDSVYLNVKKKKKKSRMDLHQMFSVE